MSLLRGENMQRKLEVASSWPQAGTDSGDNEGMNRTLARLEKSLADELTVYEAEEEEEDDENLEEEKEASAVGAGAGEEIVMELLAPKVAPPPPPLARSAPTKKMKRGGRLDSDEAELDIPGSVAETFMKRPSTGNWELLVELFRNENRRNNESNILSPPRKDQPHQVLRVESDLTFDESLEAMEENEHKELSIIYESDEETDTTRNLEEETGSVDYYESDESEEEEEEEEDLLPPPHTAQPCVLPPVVLEEVVPATEEKPPAEEPFAAGEVDWPWPDEEEEAVVPTTAVAAVPLRAAMPLREPSSPPNLPRKPTTTTIVRVPPSFANTKAKAYVLLWEKRIRRYDQSQVNVVQKSAVEPPSNVMIESTNYPNYLSNMFESRQDVAVTSCETMPPAVTTATSPAAGFIIHEEKRFVPTTNNCTPVISSTAASSSSSSRSNNIVRAEVMSWENKMSNIHKDAQHVIGARGEY